MKTFATALTLVSLCALTAILDDPASPPEPGQQAGGEVEPVLNRGGSDTACLDPWSVCTATASVATASR